MQGFLIAIGAIIIAPLLVLVADYLGRDSIVNLVDAKKQAGNDVCLVALGSLGTVFVDPKIEAAIGVGAGMIALFVVLSILILRGICRRFEKQVGSANKVFRAGMASVGLVLAIICYGYWFAR